MECTGTLKNIVRNWMSGKFEITFEVDRDITGEIDDIKDMLLAIVAKKHRKKRSLDANSYYWKLLSQFADKLNISKPYAHNLMLRKYGELEEIDGRLVYVVVPDDEKGIQRAEEAETYHIKPTSETKEGNDGTVFRTYKMLRGSSTYNTKEMSTLIGGLVEDCREQGIETMTPAEIDDLMRLFDTHWRKKHEETV